METTTDRSTLEQKLIPELQRIAQEMGIEGTQRLRKSGLIDAIVNNGGNGAEKSPPTPSPVAVAERSDEAEPRNDRPTDAADDEAGRADDSSQRTEEPRELGNERGN